ncbi:hypothetical protein GCM10008956_29850 [Deinococcus arenae]|uniref:Uncharacterized protein n=1 Tax=Deinococcus arenae TaxID=1452751 RepID=A0A8H9GRH8_9DEIO|nr:hypothetical protein [Deinococcus arenae]GGM51828.1 hypothetical protein GCM10008956_29850 [Deinococcus arenae]
MRKTILLSQAGSLKNLNNENGAVVILGPYGNNDHRGSLTSDKEYHKIVNIDYAVQWASLALRRDIIKSTILPNGKYPKITQQDSHGSHHLLLSINTIEDADIISEKINAFMENLCNSIVTIETPQWTKR